MPAVGTEPPLILPDFGTSRWQLKIERYTNFLRFRKRAVNARSCAGFQIRPDLDMLFGVRV
jgi:hypothetical protein